VPLSPHRRNLPKKRASGPVVPIRALGPGAEGNAALFPTRTLRYRAQTMTGAGAYAPERMRRGYMADKTHDQDVAFIQALAELLRENDLTELHVKREYGDTGLDQRPRVSTHRRAMVVSAPARRRPRHPPPRRRPSACPRGRRRRPRADGRRRDLAHGRHRLPAARTGREGLRRSATRSEGQTLLIVEAMKTMNQIPAPAPAPSSASSSRTSRPSNTARR
jgi:acetyl-CoA carboxylase biotin carboxyl carrier protein